MAFSAVDEAVHLLDSEASPWSIQLEVRVAGRLDEARLRQAFRRALAEHPMARARKEPSRGGEHADRWTITPRIDVDPLRAVHCADEGVVAEVRQELQNMAVPLTESPPLRARLVHSPGGDVLMLNANHAAMDGFGALRVLRSVATAYTKGHQASDGPEGIETRDPAMGPDPIEARDRLRQLSDADRRTRTRRRLALVDKLTDLILRPAHLVAEGASGEAGYGFHHHCLSEDFTGALVALPHPGTVNDLLLAALHLAIADWNFHRGRPCGRIGVLVPANLRPSQWRHEVVGNFSLPARISTDRRHRRHPQSTLAALTAQTQRKKDIGIGTALLEVLQRSHRFPLWAKQVLVMSLPLGGNRFVDTAMLSNLGALPDPPAFGTDAGRTVEAWFSPPARMPLGLTIGVVTVDNRLHLVFRYRRQLFDSAAARRFEQTFVAELENLVERVAPTAIAS